MKKILLIAAFLLAPVLAQAQSEGLFHELDCGAISNPSANRVWCLQKTTANNRIQGHIYSWKGTAIGWVDITGLGFNHKLDGATTPAVSNTSANSCGTTAAAIVGTDQAGKVTVGATSGTSCTITFSTAWTNAPACTVTNETTANLVRATSTTTTVVLAGTFVAADKLAYSCIGY